MKTLQLIFKIYITISYFPVMLAAIQKKNEIASEINGKNRMVTASSNWLSQEEIHRYDITDVNYFNPIFYRVLLPQTLRQCFCDCNWTRTHNHLVRKRTLNHLAKCSIHIQRANCPQKEVLFCEQKSLLFSHI